MKGTGAAATTTGREPVPVRDDQSRVVKRPPPAHSYSPPLLCFHAPAPPDTRPCHTRRRRRPPAAHTPPQNRHRPLPATHSLQPSPPLSCTLSPLSRRRRTAGHQFRPSSPLRGGEAATAQTTAAAAPRCAIRVGPPTPPPAIGWPTRHWFSYLVLGEWRGGRREPLLSVAAAVRRPFWKNDSKGEFWSTRGGATRWPLSRAAVSHEFK